MSDQPKILLACPISIYKDYCMMDWLLTISALSYQNYKIFLVDNSPEPYLEFLPVPDNVKYVYTKPEPSLQATLAKSWNLIRRQVIKGKYDYHFSLECDVFPPINIIEKLLMVCSSHNCIVAGVPYLTGSGKNTRLSGHKLNHHFGEINMTSYHHIESFRDMNGQVEPVHSIGTGCLLIHRDVYNKHNIMFEVDRKMECFPDTTFSLDLFRAGISIMADKSIILNHRDRDWNIIPVKKYAS